MSNQLSVLTVARIIKNRVAQDELCKNKQACLYLAFNPHLHESAWMVVWDECVDSGVSLDTLILTAKTRDQLIKVRELKSWVALSYVIANPKYSEASVDIKSAVKANPFYREATKGRRASIPQISTSQTERQHLADAGTEAYIQDEVTNYLDGLNPSAWTIFINLLYSWHGTDEELLVTVASLAGK